jgi:hypothetical protein
MASMRTALDMERVFADSEESKPRPSAGNPRPMRLSPAGPAGFPQIYLLDPDHNLIEINAAQVDRPESPGCTTRRTRGATALPQPNPS